MNTVRMSLVKSQLMFWIFTMAVYFLTETMHMLLALNSEGQLTRPIYTVPLLLTNRKENDRITLSLFRTFLAYS